MPKGQNFSTKLRYRFDNFMSKGGLSVFSALMLLFIGAIVVIAILRFIANLVAPQDSMSNLFDQWWTSFLQIADGGAIGEDTQSNVPNRVVGIIALFLGMVLFSSLVAFITSQFEAKLDELRKGKSDVVESGHTLILGFGDRVLEIIRELVVANASEHRPAVVVLSEEEKTTMDDFFRDHIEDCRNTRIITRSGISSSAQTLLRVGVSSARSIVVLNTASVADSIEAKECADARVLKTIMAIMSCTGEEKAPPVIAELHLESKRQLARSISPKVITLEEQSILAKLMVQTSRTSGLAQVYERLVGFEGVEFYFHAPKAGFGSMTYEQATFCYDNACLIGIAHADGSLIMNPPAATRLQIGDQAIVIAEDDSAISFTPDRKVADALQGGASATLPKFSEQQLIVGWGFKTSLIVDEYSRYLVDGSSIVVVSETDGEDMNAAVGQLRSRYPGINIKLLAGDIHDQQVLADLKPEEYDNIIILSPDEGEAESRDAVTIAKLLEFRRYFKQKQFQTLKTQLITEVANSDNTQVIQDVGVKDFLISNQFVSRIYAQVSEEPTILGVYEDLFSPEGAEVYLKPVALYGGTVPADTTFGALCRAALNRHETCIGVRISGEIILNPAKDRKFLVREVDQLIVLAEDES